MESVINFNDLLNLIISALNGNNGMSALQLINMNADIFFYLREKIAMRNQNGKDRSYYRNTIVKVWTLGIETNYVPKSARGTFRYYNSPY